MALSSGSYVPATAGHFGRVETVDGHAGDFVGVGPYWAEHWSEKIELSLTVTDGDDARQVDFKLGEALSLATEIVIMLEAAVGASGRVISDAERILELGSVADSLKDRLTRGAA